MSTDNCMNYGRTGKIARLPENICSRLNRFLDDLRGSKPEGAEGSDLWILDSLRDPSGDDFEPEGAEGVISARRR
jgi:hypothetical protein